MKRATFHVRGLVQGVGFRPYVYRLAADLHLAGSVRNTSTQVMIDVQGTAGAVDEFARRLSAEAPVLAVVREVERIDDDVDPALTEFTIVASESVGGRTIVPPDTATCEDCLRDLQDPANRRHRHPFITCTNCGPRYTIIRSLPYDRPGTTLADLPMCPECSVEYHDPSDRRFHAQPISCNKCGPRLWWTATHGANASRGTAGAGAADANAAEAAGTVTTSDTECLNLAVQALNDGQVLAIKGIGGYHLACSALDDDAVRTLRTRKAREAKPLAVMVPDLATAREIAQVDEVEATELTGPARPIVLLRRRADATVPIAAAVAPGNAELGIMVAYAPVHHLLFTGGAPRALVMTSGNLSGEPICYGDAEATARLGTIADAILGHDRPIAVPCDDSVVRVIGGDVHPLRRSRGYAPLPIALSAAPPARATAPGAPAPSTPATPEPTAPAAAPTPEVPTTAPIDPTPAVFAVGGELKSTVCLLTGTDAYLSQHIGDVESLAGQEALDGTRRHLSALYNVQPTAWAADLHPDYHSRRWAERHRGDLPLLTVQHHHAHAVSLLAEHRRLGQDVLVCAFDGTGYGTDGAIWGGEALLLGADVGTFERIGHLRQVPLPGGDAAVAEPWRIALAQLAAAGLPWDADLPCTQAGGGATPRLRQLLTSKVATTPSTSMGRLFDAVASLLGICQHQGYEAQAAIELEQAARTSVSTAGRLAAEKHPAPTTDRAAHRLREPRVDIGSAPSASADGQPPLIVDPGPMFAQLIDAQRAGTPVADLAWCFHDWVASAVLTWAEQARVCHEITTVGLTGGVFANRLLAELCASILTTAGFTVLTHARVPAGDGGLALGQAVIAAARLQCYQ